MKKWMSFLFVGMVVMLFGVNGCTVDHPSFNFSKSAFPGTFANAGEVITYTFVVQNTGDVSIGDITVIDDHVSVTCPASRLSSGQSMTCTATYTTTVEDVAAGVIRNNASVQGASDAQTCGDSGVSTSANASAEVVLDIPLAPPPPLPTHGDLSITKIASQAVYSRAGELIVYTYEIHNTGNVEVEGPFSIVDDKVDTWQCDDAGVAGYSLCVDCYITCKGTYTVKASDVGSDIKNVAHAGAENALSNEASAIVYYQPGKAKDSGGGEGEPPPPPPSGKPPIIFIGPG